MIDADPKDPWLKPEQVAARLGMTVSGLSSWRHDGKGPQYAKAGKLVRYRESWIAKFEEGMIQAGQKAREEAQSYQHRGAA